jgi:serine/threonine protein kinase
VAGLSERESLEILRQLLVVVDFLHGHNVAHRDIKLENVMVTGLTGGSSSSSDADSELEQEEPDAVMRDGEPLIMHRPGDLPPERLSRPCPVVKLTDFGLSYWRAPDATELKTRQRSGTPFYAAPEVLDVSDRGYIPECADLWSCGVVLYALLTRKLPFQGRTFGELRRSMNRAHVHQLAVELPCATATKHVLMSLLSVDADARPGAREAIAMVDVALQILTVH